MSTNKDIKLGTVPPPMATRDAIHIAIIPMIAGETLHPGDHVDINAQGEAVPAYMGINGTAIGIVDPFYDSKRYVIPRGQTFWLLLNQFTITSMKHHWSHPSFPESAPVETKINELKQDSERWLRAFASTAEGVGLTYGELMSAAEEYLETGDTYCFGADIDYSTDWPTFWKHYHIVTGKDIRDDEASFFRCAC